ncbi:LutC/YkgG family protein [Microbispora triticiradicis]|uniref:LutC/YkgG family protein n=1 Tax=Microbispora triticiradicis TaxID=2200763 RepID=UPI001AD74CA5|nr:LUD domain-containing protein [Microbispora triticiradicis]MBO4270896.1 lactate utilization protein C [Microbispora triticiradicis]
MSRSRDLILARVRSALAGVPDVEIPRAYRGPSATPPATPSETPSEPRGEIRLFEERLRDYRAVVHVVAEAGVPERVARSLAERGARRVAVPRGFPAAWPAAARAELVTDEPPLTAADLDALDGVLTTCAVAVAETGTIVLDAGPGQGRRALSLVPDYHLCVVRAGQIVAGVPDAVARLDPVRPLTWISGPSATSDIELNRVEGVHGPRTLEVLIVT